MKSRLIMLLLHLDDNLSGILENRANVKFCHLNRSMPITYQVAGENDFGNVYFNLEENGMNAEVFRD